ncbi:exoribonuclease II, partial [Aspergillus homomorphus CBS 101889]
MYDGCSRMSLLLSKARVSHRVAGVNRYASSLKLVRTCGIASRASPSSCRSKAAHEHFVAQRRHFNAGSKYLATQDDDLLKSSTEVERLRLRLELEQQGNIRDYLKKWQEGHDNSADPVRGPGTSNALKPSDLWVGNMLNDNRETQDAGSDALRASDESAEFLNTADEGEGLNQYLEPGDLVALSANDGLLTYAIYVRSVAKQRQFYTDKGKWRIAYPKDLEYIVKGFVPPEKVEPLLPYFPDGLAQMSLEFQSAIEGGVPRHVGADLLREVTEFDARVEELYRLNALRLDNIHDIVADDELNLEFTLEELACKALGIEEDQLDEAILFLIHRIAHENSFLIDYDRSSLFANHYLVRSRHIAGVIETVANWVHEHQEFILSSVRGKEPVSFRYHPLQQFIAKAQRLIKQSRTVRSPTTKASVGPSAQRNDDKKKTGRAVYREILTEEFTDTDRIIIEYLQQWCIPPRRMTRGHMRSAGSHIMRSTGMYSAVDLDPLTATLFLQELGIFHPWENLRLLDHHLALPGHGISPESDALWDKAVKEGKELEDKVKLEDRMKGMRVDWGDMPVYCVDDVGAKEIDDGVSLERIPGSDLYWIHVHIANPTAFIDRDTSIMKWAASRVQTLYVPERTYPMLPDSLTQKHFSLGPRRPTLTFSAKMNLQGEVLDINVANGKIRNVIYITHDRLRRIFQPTTGAKDNTKTLTVGAFPQPPPTREGLQETLTSEDEETFHTLRRLMLAFREHRRKNGAMEWPHMPDVSVSMSVGSAPLPPQKLEVTEGRYVMGDPMIRLRQHDNNPHEVPDLTKENLISFLMNLGCWVSASWLSSRNIPAIYDGTQYHPEYSKVTSENMSQYAGQQWLNMAPPTGVSASHPLHHTPLGLDVYTKSTSPLRRYNDVLAHYQIEAALQFEKEHNRRLDASLELDAASLPFSREDVDRYLSQSRWKRYQLRECERSSKQFWACMLLFRAFYFSECKLPATFECMLQKLYNNTSMAGTMYGKGWAAVIPSLGVRCQVLVPPEMKDADKLDILSLVNAKITAVDMGRQMVVMEATRFVRPFERVGEW